MLALKHVSVFSNLEKKRSGSAVDTGRTERERERERARDSRERRPTFIGLTKFFAFLWVLA